MSSLKWAAPCIYFLTANGMPITVSFVIAFVFAVLDVLCSLFKTDIVQVFIREKEETKRHELKQPKKDKKKNHKR